MLTILLDQAAIEEALTNYIGETTLGVDLSKKEVSIKLTAGRSGHGHRAEVTIASCDSDAEDESEGDAEKSLLPAADENEAEEPVVGPFD